MTLILVALAVVVAATFLIFQFADRPQVAQMTPTPGGAVNAAAQEVAFTVTGNPRLHDLSITVDGRDVTASARTVGRRVSVPTGDLPDGEHTVAVRFSNPNVFARTVNADWRFAVDTKAPPLKIIAPPAGSVSPRAKVRFAGTSEPGSTVTIAYRGGTRAVTTGPKGRWVGTVKLPEGVAVATVTAVDHAGNTTRRGRRTGVDTTAPNLSVSAPSSGPMTETDEPRIYGRVAGDNPRELTFTVMVNGQRVLRVPGSQAAGGAQEGDGYTEASADASALQLDGDRFALSIGKLPQGKNSVSVIATDRARNASSVKHTVMVDSSDTFGVNDMVLGARGADVTQLQERLREAGVLKSEPNGEYDRRTLKAVRAYQRQQKIPVNGRVDEKVRSAMIGKIVVTLSDFTLRLIRGGKVVKTYKIATGQPGHETPTGEYRVIEKQMNPTWFPPDSPWAAGLGPIPPGPGNPLGTRWIGTSAPAIGIHGTYADGSIGTRASHGCMRMHIPDVEALYDEVSVGTPVIIKP